MMYMFAEEIHANRFLKNIAGEKCRDIFNETAS